MCDTLVCLTSSGVLFAKNSDRDPNEAQTLRWFPGQSHDVGADLRCTFSTISQVEHTHGVVLSQPWWMWGAEMGTNEHGLVIGNEAVFSRGAPRASTGSELLGMDLVRLALERARTAEEAAGVIVALLETHGQGGPCSWEHPRFTYDNSFLIADPSGALVLETAGRAWASERVAGRGRSISNGYTIGSFGRHYADRAREQVGRASSRRARTQAAVARAQSPGDLFAALREHEGAAPKYNAVSGALGAPCAHAGGAVTSTQSTASWVADLRDASTPVHWATATSAPCTSTFFPFTVDESASDLAALADEGAAPLRNVHDSAHRWWRHERLHRLVLRDPSAAMARFRPERDRIEAGWLADSGIRRPGIREALATIEDAESRWYAELLAMALPERRPSWLRALWSRLDGAAHLPEHRNGPSGVGAR